MVGCSSAEASLDTAFEVSAVSSVSRINVSERESESVFHFLLRVHSLQPAEHWTVFQVHYESWSFCCKSDRCVVTPLCHFPV